MASITPEEAIERARRALNLSGAAAPEIWKVARLDHPGSFYYLAAFRQGTGLAAVAIVDAASGEIRQSTRPGGEGACLPITAAAARQVAQLEDTASTDLVWQPCAASLSPFYPLWRIAGAGQTVFVDQQGRLWDQLKPAGPG